MPSRFDSLYEHAWKGGGSPPSSGQLAAVSLAEPERSFDRRVPGRTFAEWEARIRKELGARVASMEPSIARAREIVTALFPSDGPSQVHGPDRLAHHIELAQLFNQLEDLLQALQMASGVH